MKKAIILVLLISLFVFSGCADKNAGQESTPTPEATHTQIPSTPTPTQEPTPKPTPMPTVEPGTGKYAGEVDETNGIKADFYEGGWDGQQAHRVNGSLCIQFLPPQPLTKLGFACLLGLKSRVMRQQFLFTLGKVPLMQR